MKVMSKEIIEKFILEALKIPGRAEISPPPDPTLGDFATPVALRVAKERKTDPFALANEFSEKLSSRDQGKLFAKIEAVRPGFINFYLNPDFVRQEFAGAIKNKGFRAENFGQGKRVLVEYSSPNIAKPMHVGHLRSTILGEAISNIHEALGYKAIRWNYIGDWGTQFGKLIAAYKLWGDKKKIEKAPIEELLALYVRFHDELKTRPELEAMGRDEFKKLEQGSRESRHLWQWFRKESLKVFSAAYRRMGVKFQKTIGESSYEKDLQPLVKALLSLTGVVEKSEGALIFPLGRFNLPPALIQKSDGASLYITRDIAALKIRLKKYKPVKFLYVVGNEQALHFEQLFAIAKVLRLDGAELAHVKFGLVLGPDGKKFSTREGRTIQLEELLDEAISRAYKVVSQKNPDLSGLEKRLVAEAVGIGALKYYTLKENRQSDITFDWEAMLDFTGDSVPYLQYTYTRLRSILRKRADKRGSKNTPRINADEQAVAQELGIMKKILNFSDVLALCAKSYQTSHLAKYLYDFSKLMSRYYETTPILSDKDDSRRKARLALIQVAANTIERGLGLLGIKVIERM